MGSSRIERGSAASVQLNRTSGSVFVLDLFVVRLVRRLHGPPFGAPLHREVRTNEHLRPLRDDRNVTENSVSVQAQFGHELEKTHHADRSARAKESGRNRLGIPTGLLKRRAPVSAQRAPHEQLRNRRSAVNTAETARFGDAHP